jgi:pimeloyl-ACP methyl ester carboxylesterase
MTPAAAIAAVEAGQARHVTAAGPRIVWRSWGQGPVLVLVHGHFGGWTHWIRNIGALSQRFRLLLPDLPGFGESDDPPAHGDIAGLATALRQGLDVLLGGDARVAVGGFSLGGLVAAELAAQLGPRATACLLVSTGRGLRLPYATLPPLLPWRGLPEAERLAAHRRNLEILMIAEPGRIDALALHLQAMNTAACRYRHAPDHEGDSLRRRLADLACPLTGIWGARDRLIGPHLEARRTALRAIQPDARVVFLEDAGHWLPYEVADAFNAAVLDALA